MLKKVELLAPAGNDPEFINIILRGQLMNKFASKAAGRSRYKCYFHASRITRKPTGFPPVKKPGLSDHKLSESSGIIFFYSRVVTGA